MALGDSLKYTVGLDMSDAKRQLQAFGSFASGIGRGLGTLTSAATKIGTGLAAGLTAGALALKSITDTGGQFEAFQMRLETMMGSTAEAKARMSELFDFAAKTPFELDQIVAAEVTLRGFSADTEKLMQGLIDFSATTGAELGQSAVDFGKAWSQGAVGLESDFGKILRKQIELKSGVDATSMSIEDFRATMVDVLDNGMFAGGAERLSQTFVGMVSNLADEWGRFKLAVADAGLFNNVKGALRVTLDLISENREAIGETARAVSDKLWGGFRLVVTTVGVLTDAAEDFAFTLSTKVVTAALDVADAFLAGSGFAREMAATLMEMGGDEAGAEAMRRLGDAGARALSNLRAENEHFNSQLDLTTDKTQAAIDFLNKAEAAAASFGAEVARGFDQASGGGSIGGADSDEDRKKSLSFLEDLRAANMTAEEEEDARYLKRLEQLDTLKLAEAEWAEAVQLIHEEHEAAVDAMALERHEKEKAYLDELAKLKEQQAEEDRRRQRAYASDIISLTSSLLGTIEGQLDKSNEEQKALAKGLAYAQIAISTAAGISKAWQDYGFPAAIPVSAIVAGVGIAQAAEVSAAHQGRTGDVVYAHQGRQPDEVDMRVLRTESTLNSQATRALGAKGVQDLNSGRGLEPREISVTIGRVTSREAMREERRASGPLTRYARDLFGSSSDGDRDFGFSGRRAFA